MLLRLGDQLMIGDRMPGGAPGPAYGRAGWGMPSYSSLWRPGGPMKPVPIGARYFCGDDYPQSVAQTEPCATGNIYQSSKSEYQDHVTAHYAEEHPDLHYPINQTGIDDMHAAKRKAEALLRLQADVKAHEKWNAAGVGGGMDLSSELQGVSRPRELPDFTEFDFPDANLADAAAEEIELDQLISIAARQGRRLLGMELQNVDEEFGQEYLTAIDNADLDITFSVELNTRTGVHNLDDPEQLMRLGFRTVIANIEATAGTGTAISQAYKGENTVPKGGTVYVAPRLFFRVANAMDRQIDIGDMFVRIATINQPLSTFLLFELLEQFSGLFGLT